MSTAAEPRPSTLQVWRAAIRPATLWAGSVPVLVGTAIASARGTSARALLAALGCLVGALLLQIGCNLVNDYADFHKGADGADRLGPARATAKGWLTSRQVAGGAAVSLALAAAVGAGLVSRGGTPILVLGVLSVLAAIAYTAGPFPLGYKGLGDVFVLAFFGFGATVGTVWVQIAQAPAEAWLAGAAVGALATAILVVNNLRDRVGDARAGKRTLAVRFGEAFARRQYAALVVAAFALSGASAVVAGWGRLLPLLAIPLAAKAIGALRRVDGAALNPWLGATARMELVFGLLYCVGVALQAALS